MKHNSDLFVVVHRGEHIKIYINFTIKQKALKGIMGREMWYLF